MSPFGRYGSLRAERWILASARMTLGGSREVRDGVVQRAFHADPWYTPRASAGRRTESDLETSMESVAATFP
jgi:hypothetical protein